MDKQKERQDRPESYPKPTETDSQLKNQPEYIDQQPNDFSDKSISDIATPDTSRQSNADNTTRQDQ
jgi:hypothetical protein